MTEPTPYSSAPAENPADYPGKTLGIVALVLAFLFPRLGLILVLVANNQSKAAGYANPFAKWAIILSIIFLVIGLIVGIIVAVTSAALFSTVGYY